MSDYVQKQKEKELERVFGNGEVKCPAFYKNMFMNSNITAKVEFISPADAVKMLEKAKPFRKVSKKLVERYADDMVNKRWNLNGETIIIDEDGYVDDGNHRLPAIIAGEIALPCLVVRGVGRNSIFTQGIGKKRTATQIARRAGYETPQVLTTAAGHLIQYKTSKEIKHEVPSIPEEMEFIRKNPSLQKDAEFCSCSAIKSLTSGATAAAAYFLFQEISKPHADKFFNELKSRKTNFDAIADLIRKLDILRSRKTMSDAPSEMPLFFDSWNSMIEKKPMKKKLRSLDLPELLHP